ncbi:hypothetical protein FB451DRAFT_1485453 [Mycena latifolia]|nr:hypothetical protein FB451DRAFT_1485453 [Mycena latifolia]
MSSSSHFTFPLTTTTFPMPIASPTLTFALALTLTFAVSQFALTPTVFPISTVIPAPVVSTPAIPTHVVSIPVIPTAVVSIPVISSPVVSTPVISTTVLSTPVFSLAPTIVPMLASTQFTSPLTPTIVPISMPIGSQFTSPPTATIVPMPSVSQFPSPQIPPIVVINGSESAWAITAAEVFLYGAYLVLFGFYLYVLRTGGMAKHRFLNVSTISLFILCTAHCALVLNIPRLRTRLNAGITAGDVEGTAKRTAEESSLVFATNAVYVTSNVIADSIFIFRCYAIWNSRRKIIILPTLLTVAVAGTFLLLESGAIYGAGGLAYIILGFVTVHSETMNYDITTSGAILGQLVVSECSD